MPLDAVAEAAAEAAAHVATEAGGEAIKKRYGWLGCVIVMLAIGGLIATAIWYFS